jgi:hypothetical protein
MSTPHTLLSLLLAASLNGCDTDNDKPAGGNSTPVSTDDTGDVVDTGNVEDTGDVIDTGEAEEPGRCGGGLLTDSMTETTHRGTISVPLMLTSEDGGGRSFQLTAEAPAGAYLMVARVIDPSGEVVS